MPPPPPRRPVPSRDVRVVYVGETSSLQNRMKGYAANGSHLGTRVVFNDALFAGYTIYYRFLPQEDKKAAVIREKMMLKRFDYAWNKVNQFKVVRRGVAEIFGADGAAVRTPPLSYVFPSVLCYYLLFTHTLNLHISFSDAQSPSGDESSGSGDESDCESIADGYAVRTPPPLS